MTQLKALEWLALGLPVTNETTRHADGLRYCCLTGSATGEPLPRTGTTSAL
jgi:hypothetical protein